MVSNEYIESTGTQYIDTGIKAQVGIKVEMEFSFTNLVGQAPFGCHYNAPNMSFLIVGTPLRWSMITNGTQKTNSNETPQNNTNYKAEFYVGEDEQYLKINGENLIGNTLTITGINAYNLYLFRRNSSGSPSPASIKLYYCKIWLNDVLVRDFVPYYDYSTNKACLYDEVTQTCFYNAGTGEFTYSNNNLIFDRTQYDVNYAKQNQSRKSNLKGAYNYSDLNRVEEWCEYLATTLTNYRYPVTITTKTDWNDTDFPTQAHLERIRSNVQAIKQAYYSATNTPSSLSHITYQQANDIEKILFEINTNLKNMIAAFFYSGEIYAGEV